MGGGEETLPVTKAEQKSKYSRERERERESKVFVLVIFIMMNPLQFTRKAKERVDNQWDGWTEKLQGV